MDGRSDVYGLKTMIVNATQLIRAGTVLTIDKPMTLKAGDEFVGINTDGTKAEGIVLEVHQHNCWGDCAAKAKALVKYSVGTLSFGASISVSDARVTPMTISSSLDLPDRIGT